MFATAAAQSGGTVGYFDDLDIGAMKASYIAQTQRAADSRRETDAAVTTFVATEMASILGEFVMKAAQAHRPAAFPQDSEQKAVWSLGTVFPGSDEQPVAYFVDPDAVLHVRGRGQYLQPVTYESFCKWSVRQDKDGIVSFDLEGAKHWLLTNSRQRLIALANGAKPL